MSGQVSSSELPQAPVGRTTRPEVTPPGMLAAHSGSLRWLLELSEIGEVVTVPALFPVPLTRRWCAGLANVRGTLHCVIDLSLFHGGEATPTGGESRLLLVAARHGINSALLVNRVPGLKSEGDAEPVAVERPEWPWAGDGVRDAAGEIWMQLKLPVLLRAPQFLGVGL